MSKFILCMLGQFVLLSSAFGQSPAKPTPGELKAQEELNGKARLLLQETLQQSRQLKNKQNQVLAKINLADLLWKDQEAVARRLYQEAVDILRQTRDEMDEADSESIANNADVLRLRDRVLQSLGRHDPALAKEFLLQTKVVSQVNSAGENPAASADTSTETDEDTRLELALAIEAIDKNPDEAVRVGRKALSQGYSYELTSLLLKLAEKDRKVAGELAVEVANKLRKADFGSEPEAVGIALFFVADAIQSLKPETPKGNKDEDAAENSAPLLDQQFAREFLEFIIDAAIKKQPDPGNSYLLFNLRTTVAELEVATPAPAARLKQRLAEFEKEDEAAGSYARLTELSQTKDVEALLETARTAPPEMRESLYGQAATAAWEKGDETRAKEIVTKNISNYYERNRLLASFQEQTIQALMAKEDFDHARQLIGKTRSLVKRVGYLLDLAAALHRKGDKKGALEILNGAQNLMPVKATNSDEFEVQLRVASAFSELDADRSFALYTSVIDQINELLEATAKIANFSPMPISIRNNEFPIESYTALPGLGMLFSRDLRPLAQADFEKTRAMLERFQRPEIRIAGYLYVAKTILEPDPDCACACPDPVKKENKTVNK